MTRDRLEKQNKAPKKAKRKVTPAGPLIYIELDAGISGGFVHGRFDVMIRGRAVSAASIAEIRLQAGDWVTSIASFGQPERAPVAVLPDGSAARQRAFHFNLPRPGDGRSETCAFQVIARTEDGFEHVEHFAVLIDLTAIDQVTFVSGQTRPGAGAFNPHSVMYIERATIDANGLLTVQGWAVALGVILAVEVLADNENVGTARIGGERHDVAAVFPAYPNGNSSGFGLTRQLDETSREAERIQVRVLCPNGFSRQESVSVERLQHRAAARPQADVPAIPEPETAPPPPPALPPHALPPHALPPHALPSQQPGHHAHAALDGGHDPRFGLRPPGPVAKAMVDQSVDGSAPAAAAKETAAEIRMHCDIAVLTGDGILSLIGWAVCPVGVVQVRVLLDDQDVGLAAFGYPRPDLGDIFPDISMVSLSGFVFERSVGANFDSLHEVRIVVRNMAGDETETRVPVTATEIARAVQPLAAVQFQPAPAPAAEPNNEFRFELDSPSIENGVAGTPIVGRLTIDGWLLSRTGVASFEVFLDGKRLGDAYFGQARQDVAAAFPEWPNALRSGYAFHCPSRSLTDGDHRIELRIRSSSGEELVRSFLITVQKSGDQENNSAGIRRRVARVEIDMMIGFLADLHVHPSFQYVLRQDQTIDPDRMRATIEALRLQAYPDWTVLVLAHDEDTAAAVQAILTRQVPHLISRFTVICPAQADIWNAPLVDANNSRADFLGLLLPGDQPGADALLELAVASGRNPSHDLLYGDEVRPSPVSKVQETFCKPDFSPDLLGSTNYIGRPWVATAALLAKTGVTPASLIADGEYDLVLRCAELAQGVHHIPKPLCQRMAPALDDAETEQAALERMLVRRGIAGQVLETPIPGTWRVRRTTPSRGKVSIIIPTCAALGIIETCIKTLRTKTAYRDFEIICIDNIPDTSMAWKIWLRRNADKVVEIPQAFNWSTFNNKAAQVADGEYLLFLNDDIEVTQDDWLDAMMEHASRPEVGITGPRLLYPDGKVQHVGMFLANSGIGRHAFRFAAQDDPCYFGLALTQRNVIAVTGACMLVRRETFDRLGGFDEAHEIINNDLDFCLRAHRSGLLTVFTPYATLTHYEQASRATMKDVFDLDHFHAVWRTTFAAGDPYFNPRLASDTDDYRPDEEPVQWVVSGAPMFLPQEIQKILVVKLDHIGDFVTALPPIRRLKKLFPHAGITVLAGPASRAFTVLEPSIDELIPFEFFHARSQLGQRDLTQEDYEELGRQLQPYRFDLAVDLRKHTSTRDVLKYSGARFLAGFDSQGQFPFLDIALNWDGDRNLQRKRSHIVDDLLALVNVIGQASESDRDVMQPVPSAMPIDQLPDDIQPLFTKPVVAIHPGAGNLTKQWPREHFSALIDLLIEKNDVDILIVGGPDEVPVADALLKNALHPNAVRSVAGQTRLSDLPSLLLNCDLFIGNDSGPKHIAAAVGIPTVGIHSGVVDPVEWGPIGAHAVALRRDMSCSPCYLENAEDCPRSLACLRLLEPASVYRTADLMLKRRHKAIAPLAAVETIDDESAGATDDDRSAKPKPSRKSKRRQPVTVSA
jgi:ADP-heptose:LPS heptosyltransferase/GT2 family glycosyltransferase